MINRFFKSRSTNYCLSSVFLLIVIFASAVIEVFQSALFQLLMGRAIGNNSYDIWLLMLLCCCYLLSSLLFGLAYSKLCPYVLGKIRVGLSEDLFNSMVLRPAFDQYEEGSSSALISLIDNEVNIVVDNYYYILLQIFGLIGSFALGLVYLCWLNPYFLIPIFVAFSALIVVILLAKSPASRKMTEFVDRNRKLVKSLTNVSSFFFEARIFSFQKYLLKEANRNYQAYSDSSKENLSLSMEIQKINEFISLAAAVSIYVIAVFLAVDGKIGGDAIAGAISIAGTVLTPFFSLSWFASSLNRSKGVRKKITRLLDTPLVEGKKPVASISEIAMENISFSYGEHCVLRDYSFTITKGELVGISGESGSGKTTFLKLLTKQVLPSSGVITINGDIKINELFENDYFQRISFLPQEPSILNETVKVNIVLGRVFDQKRFSDVCNLFQLDKAFGGLERGFDTKLDAEKNNLSLGEKRRIGLARAFYGNPDFLFLDEPFASLDSSNVSIVEKAILEKKGKYGIIVVSHNFETCLNKSCDRIISIDKVKF
jgi:ATP-binding cassette, subfamily B, bacterial